MTLAPINMATYTRRFTEFPSELLAFAAQHALQLPPLTTMRGQALALMAQPEVAGRQFITPADTTAFFQAIGMETRDAIQQFNKATGIKRVPKRGVYCLQYPFECDTTDLDKRKGVAISGDRDTSINAIKDWHRKNITDVPNEEWQIGHLDPTVDDASERNLAYQPPLQGKYRNRFKWDAYFHKMWPTAAELVPKFDEYYSQKEQEAIYQHLKGRFEPQPQQPQQPPPADAASSQQS